MKGRFWFVWTLVIAVLALAAMPALALPQWGASAVTAHLPPIVSAPVEEKETEGLVDLNSADLEELMTLPGIGEVRAAAIIEYRDSCGAFRYPEELVNVPGIGEGILAGLIDLVTTGGG